MGRRAHALGQEKQTVRGTAAYTSECLMRLSQGPRVVGEHGASGHQNSSTSFTFTLSENSFHLQIQLALQASKTNPGHNPHSCFVLEPVRVETLTRLRGGHCGSRGCYTAWFLHLQGPCGHRTTLRSSVGTMGGMEAM